MGSTQGPADFGTGKVGMIEHDWLEALISLIYAICFNTFCVWMFKNRKPNVKGLDAYLVAWHYRYDLHRFGFSLKHPSDVSFFTHFRTQNRYPLLLETL
ncbi:hypothetical protein C9E81_15020 [Paracoccus alkanivorans]|uniref:Uncharacterized protein n=1 Tax=Paracoccus alkanivorans TaxID=2116655 RepID=A0A3M0M8A0_9RHOB|nr:hypothetical protein C9E81_15020 [Paracoccus alkanivorans]